MGTKPHDFVAWQAYQRKNKKVYAIESIKYGHSKILKKYCSAPDCEEELMVEEIKLICPPNMKKRKYIWNPSQHNKWEGDLRDLEIMRFEGFSGS